MNEIFLMFIDQLFTYYNVSFVFVSLNSIFSLRF